MSRIKTFNQYFTICVSVIILFSFYSIVLDQLFFHIDYGKYEDSIISVFFYYVSYFIIFYFPFWVIIILFYNWIVIEKLKAFPNLPLFRIVFGLITGFIIGLICRHAQGTF